MKRSHKMAIIAIAHLILLYALCFAGNVIMYGCTWLNAWEALKTLGISLGITVIIFIICFLSHKWLREEKKIEVNATYDNIIELHWHWYMKSLTNRNQATSIINHDSYEQALLAGIKEAVKILKEE